MGLFYAYDPLVLVSVPEPHLIVANNNVIGWGEAICMYLRSVVVGGGGGW